MINYDKDEIKSQLDTDDYFQLLIEFGGNPIIMPFGIISETICHNPPGVGSRKLYFYSNSSMFHCFTGGCEESSFDIYELVMKIAKIQWNQNYGLNDAVRWIARRFGISGTALDDEVVEQLEDWKLFAGYDRIKEIELSEKSMIILKEYDSSILDKFNYKIKIKPWLDEDINQESLSKAKIGYYLGGDQITIPHFDLNDRFIGLRGRSVSVEECEKYGKYRPLKLGKEQFNHPLGFNLYGLNWNKKNIKTMRKAIVLESEKSVLKYGSMFGWENNISVACCGSHVSQYQIQLLEECGAKEIIIALDRQFKEKNDNEFNQLIKNLKKINNKYKNYIQISIIFDKNMITAYKASPVDEGIDKFL